jgi:nodulation protein E
MKKTIVITGMGTINSLGLNVPQTLEAMREGHCGISQMNIKDIDKLAIKIGAQIHAYDPNHYFSKRHQDIYDRFTQFQLLSANEAILESGLEIDGEVSFRTGISLGTAGGGVETWDESYRMLYTGGRARVPPFIIPRLMPNSAASHISINHNIKGPSFTVSTACASSNHAMVQAYMALQSGIADVMITGGSESMLHYGGIKSWEGMRVMSNDTCRPFSKNRSGLVHGEGAAAFVFETYEHARDRGANIIAEVLGGSMTADSSDIVMLTTEGTSRALQECIKNCKINKEQVGYINAHGTGTIPNDKKECEIISNVFGDHANKLMVSSTKAMHGHVIGGTSAIELLACISAVRDNVIIPTINYDFPDPECPLDIVPNDARQAKVDVAFNNAFAFGGLNSVLAIRRAP